MSTALYVAILLFGCSPQSPEEAVVDAAIAQADGPKAKAGKTGKSAKSAKHKKGGKAKKGKAKGGKGKAAKARPVGAEGPVLGELKLTEVEEPAKKAKVAPAAVEEVVEGAEVAAAPESVMKTQADLHLTFGPDSEELDVQLGKVTGTCVEVTPEPVGPVGKEQTPLWTVACGEGEDKTTLYILQSSGMIAVLKEVPATEEGAVSTFKAVKRVPLVKGAELQRQG